MDYQLLDRLVEMAYEYDRLGLTSRADRLTRIIEAQTGAPTAENMQANTMRFRGKRRPASPNGRTQFQGQAGNVPANPNPHAVGGTGYVDMSHLHWKQRGATMTGQSVGVQVSPEGRVYDQYGQYMGVMGQGTSIVNPETGAVTGSMSQGLVESMRAGTGYDTTQQALDFAGQFAGGVAQGANGSVIVDPFSKATQWAQQRGMFQNMPQGSNLSGVAQQAAAMPPVESSVPRPPQSVSYDGGVTVNLPNMNGQTVPFPGSHQGKPNAPAV
jgi:hypothetical protein